MSAQQQVNDNRDAYIGLRHLSPETVRMMRFALDTGVSVNKIRAGIKKQKGAADLIQANLIQLTLDCLDYLVSNPSAGVVCWLEGEQYDFVDRLTESGRLPAWYQPPSKEKDNSNDTNSRT